MINKKNRHCRALTKVVRVLALFQTSVGYLLLFILQCFFVGLRIAVTVLYEILTRGSTQSYRAVKSMVSKVRMFKLPKPPKISCKRFRINVYAKGFIIFSAGVLFAVVFIFVPFRVYTWYRNIPRPELLGELGNNKSTRILDRNGRLLYEIYVDRKYNPVVLEDIPQHVVQATLAIEDDSFYSHHGFRLDSMMRAAKASVFEDDLQGASTVTQQLVKNVLLTPERTVARKLKELVLSILIERKYSKEEILELYMNNIPYGGTAWGVEASAQKFFGKHVWELDLAEASMLAGFPSAPSIYSPAQGDMDLAKKRQSQILHRMVTLGYITQTDADNAYAEELKYVEQKEFIQAPHFVTYVRELLEKEYGKRYVEFGGLTVKTTLDLDLQEKVQELVRTGVENNLYLNISNGAVVVLDSKTSEILAYAGSIDYFKDVWGAFDVVAAFRQPGSSIKPITYALAFERGLTPAFVIEDSPVVYKSVGETYKPVNYDGRFHGKVTLRDALANSYNVPAVKLADRLKPDNIVALGKSFGLVGWEVDGSYGLSVTLGGKEVRLLDLTNVYATFARSGVYKPVKAISSVKDAYGYEVYVQDTSERRVLSAEMSYLVTNILSDNVARLPAFGSNSALVVPGYTVAVKTGTTDAKRDNWTFGYTPSFTIGVWVGNNDNTPMNRYLASGLSGAAPIWNSVMKEVLKNSPNESFDKPEKVFVKFDEKCNKSEIFIEGSTVPEHLCVIEDDDEDDKKAD